MSPAGTRRAPRVVGLETHFSFSHGLPSLNFPSTFSFSSHADYVDIHGHCSGSLPLYWPRLSLRLIFIFISYYFRRIQCATVLLLFFHESSVFLLHISVPGWGHSSLITAATISFTLPAEMPREVTLSIGRATYLLNITLMSLDNTAIAADTLRYGAITRYR